MKVIGGQTIINGVVMLDDHHFENCVVKDSVVIYAGGEYSWTNCSFTNCQIRWIGPAGRSMQMARNFGLKITKDDKIEQMTGSATIQ